MRWALCRMISSPVQLPFLNIYLLFEILTHVYNLSWSYLSLALSLECLLDPPSHILRPLPFLKRITHWVQWQGSCVIHWVLGNLDSRGHLTKKWLSFPGTCQLLGGGSLGIFFLVMVEQEKRLSSQSILGSAVINPDCCVIQQLLWNKFSPNTGGL